MGIYASVAGRYIFGGRYHGISIFLINRNAANTTPA